MSEQVHEIDAYDYAEAEQWAREHTPHAHFYKILKQGEKKTVKVEGWGETVEQAAAQAQQAIPKSMKVDYDYTANAWQEAYTIQARSPRAAEVEAIKRLIENHVRLFERKGSENRFCWFDPTNNLGYGPLSTLTFQHSEADPEYQKAKTRLEQRLVQQHTKILGISLDGPRSFWGPLGRSSYKIEVLHYAKSVITCNEKSKYSVLITDDSCKVDIHTWGPWLHSGEEYAGYEVNKAKVFGSRGYRTCSQCGQEENCHHDFGDWEADVAYNEIIGRSRICKICGAKHSWRHSGMSSF